MSNSLIVLAFLFCISIYGMGPKRSYLSKPRLIWLTRPFLGLMNLFDPLFPPAESDVVTSKTNSFVWRVQAWILQRTTQDSWTQAERFAKMLWISISFGAFICLIIVASLNISGIKI